MNGAEWNQIVGDIYIAAADAESWTALPGRLAPLFGASMCTLWSHNGSTGQPEDTLTTTLSPEAVDLYAKHYYSRDPWRAEELRVGWDVALPGSAMVEDKILAASDYYADFGRLNETFHLLGSRHQLSARSGIVSKVVFCRPQGMETFSAAEFALMDRLIPHLRRAWQMKHQIAAAGERTTRIAWEAGLASAISSMPGAALAADWSGRVRFANAAAERLAMRSGGISAGAGVDSFLRPSTKAECARLRRAVIDAANGGAGDAFLLGAGQDEVCRVVVTPLAADGDNGKLALILVTPMAVSDDSTAIARAMRMSGLTQAEAEVTLALVRGLSPAEVAKVRRVKITTVRTLLLRAQYKLNARDLRGLVAAATLFRAD